MNIYIGNFPYDVMGDDLKEIFKAYGYVEKANVIRDKFTGQSKGFGFVQMPNRNEAEAALKGITEIKGRKVNINEARPQMRDEASGGRRGGFRGKDQNRGKRMY